MRLRGLAVATLPLACRARAPRARSARRAGAGARRAGRAGRRAEGGPGPDGGGEPRGPGSAGGRGAAGRRRSAGQRASRDRARGAARHAGALRTDAVRACSRPPWLGGGGQSTLEPRARLQSAGVKKRIRPCSRQLPLRLRRRARQGAIGRPARHVRRRLRRSAREGPGGRPDTLTIPKGYQMLTFSEGKGWNRGG